MAYTKTVWEPRQGSNLNKFTKSQETGGTVVLTNTPDAVTAPGTPFSADNMNRIEEGVAEAHGILAGVRAVPLAGALLTRAPGGLTEIQKSLFGPGAVFIAGKTVIFDASGTEGVYTGDAGSGAAVVLTKSTSPAGSEGLLPPGWGRVLTRLSDLENWAVNITKWLVSPGGPPPDPPLPPENKILLAKQGAGLLARADTFLFAKSIQ